MWCGPNNNFWHLINCPDIIIITIIIIILIIIIIIIIIIIATIWIAELPRKMFPLFAFIKFPDFSLTLARLFHVTLIEITDGKLVCFLCWLLLQYTDTLSNFVMYAFLTIALL